MLSAANGYGTYNWTFDDAGETLTQTDPNGLTLTYGHDANGNVTSVLDSLGGLVTSVFDADNRLTSRQFSGTGQVPLRIDLAYTPDGMVSTETRYSDLAGTQKVGSTANTYDTVNNVTEIKHENAAGAVIEDFQYAYDSGDRLSSETDTNAEGTSTTTPYTYDNADQLTGAGASAYAFDPNGNRTMAGYQMGLDNRLLADPNWVYQYDNEGNVVGKTSTTSAESWSYNFDQANHLTGGTHKDASGTVVAVVTEKYDVLEHRAEEDVYTPANGVTTVQKYAWDGDNVWADLTGSNQLQTRRLYLDGANQPFARVSAAGAANWYLTDHLGSVRALTDDSTGAVVDEIRYEAFGSVPAGGETQPGVSDRYLYAGYQRSAALGLDLAKWRWYNPQTGTWGAEDQSGFRAGDGNLYRYAGNDPTNGTDPNGLHTTPVTVQELRERDRREDMLDAKREAATRAAWRAEISRSRSALRPAVLDSSIGLFFDGTWQRKQDNTSITQLFNKYHAPGLKFRYEFMELGGSPTGATWTTPPQIGADMDAALQAKATKEFDEVVVKSVRDVQRAISKDTKIKHVDIFGYSRGAIAAIYVAKELKRKGIEVRYMGLIDPSVRYSGKAVPQIPDSVKQVSIAYADGRGTIWNRKILSSDWLISIKHDNITLEGGNKKTQQKTRSFADFGHFDIGREYRPRLQIWPSSLLNIPLPLLAE